MIDIQNIKLSYNRISNKVNNKINNKIYNNLHNNSNIKKSV